MFALSRYTRPNCEDRDSRINGLASRSAILLQTSKISDAVATKSDDEVSRGKFMTPRGLT